MFTHLQRRSFVRSSGFAALAVSAVLGLAAQASASIVGSGGNIHGPYSSPTNDLRLNRTEDNTRMWVFSERQNVVVPPNIKYHAKNNGNYATHASLTSQPLPYAGVGVVNSYMLHFDPTSGIPPKSASGYVDFNNPIYIITHPNNDLDISDGPFGFPTTQYASAAFSIADRGFDLAGANDNFSISNPSAGVWRLDFDVTASTGMDELRVIEYVSVPEPASLGAIGATLLVLRRRR